jgi:hypothetical protein
VDLGYFRVRLGDVSQGVGICFKISERSNFISVIFFVQHSTVHLAAARSMLYFMIPHLCNCTNCFFTNHVLRLTISFVPAHPMTRATLHYSDANIKTVRTDETNALDIDRYQLCLKFVQVLVNQAFVFRSCFEYHRGLFCYESIPL